MQGDKQKMVRPPCGDENGLKKGPWTPDEDEKLVQHIQNHGHGSWRALPKLAGLNRCGKSCRLRWINYLRPDIKKGKFSQEEEQTILHLHSILGNKWSAIATHLPGRTDNEIKNFWNTHLKKRLIQMGFDPMTHQPRTDLFSSLPHLMALANLKDLVENHPLLRAEAQLARLQYLQYIFQSATNSVTSTSFSQSGMTDIEVLELLNSIKENQLVIPMEDQPSSISMGNINGGADQPLHHHHNLSPPLSHLSDPQHVAFQTCLMTNHEIIDQTDIIADNLSDDPIWVNLPSPTNPSAPPSVTETPPMRNPAGDASTTTSSYGGETNSSLCWNQFSFEDSILQEL